MEKRARKYTTGGRKDRDVSLGVCLLVAAGCAIWSEGKGSLGRNIPKGGAGEFTAKREGEASHTGSNGLEQTLLDRGAMRQAQQQDAGVLEVVDGADADGAEVAHEDGVAPAEHEQAEGQEARAGDAGVVGAGAAAATTGRERGPRHRHADVGEARQVQQHVDARVEVVVPSLRLRQELTVPVERAPGREARQQVARAERAAGAEDEEL